ncbi:MAG: hypothetical protein OEY49_19070, partial [Candidatus Heimdallarchaeota archaeon]|nr:hypothetical protein [Candidatus Heimdallarchaeota archaeon]
MFQVLHGSDDTKNILVDILHSQGGNETGLKEFLKDIEEIENGNGNWWIAVDENKVPRGALTVRYINELSYLRYIWTMIYKNEDQSILYNALLNAWIENSRQGTKQYQIDLQIYSPLIKCVMDAGFRRQKLLLTSYEIKSDWYNTELPLGYVMRPVRREELDLIYQKLIAPDLDT